MAGASQTANGSVVTNALHVMADDGQPDWAQEWEDFGEVYDDEPDYI